MPKVILKKELCLLGKNIYMCVCQNIKKKKDSNFDLFYITFLLKNRDAAHTIHPLAGQGLNQGLADVQCLLKVIEQGIINGQDIGIVF